MGKIDPYGVLAHKFEGFTGNFVKPLGKSSFRNIFSRPNANEVDEEIGHKGKIVRRTELRMSYSKNPEISHVKGAVYDKESRIQCRRKADSRNNKIRKLVHNLANEGPKQSCNTQKMEYAENYEKFGAENIGHKGNDGCRTQHNKSAAEVVS